MGLFNFGGSQANTAEKKSSDSSDGNDYEFGGRWSALWLFVAVMLVGLVFWLQGVLARGGVSELMQGATSFWGQSEWVLEKE